MRANEPGNHFYALHRSGTDSQVYKVMEQYASQEALEAHSQSVISARRIKSSRLEPPLPRLSCCRRLRASRSATRTDGRRMTYFDPSNPDPYKRMSWALRRYGWVIIPLAVLLYVVEVAADSFGYDGTLIVQVGFRSSSQWPFTTAELSGKSDGG